MRNEDKSPPRTWGYKHLHWAVSSLLWLAGWMEGEGCFYVYRGAAKDNSPGPRVSGVSTDRDSMERVASMFGTKVTVRKAQGARKVQYCTVASGHKALAIMEMLYPLMHSRRRGKIRESIEAWHTLKRVKSLRTAIHLYVE